MKLSIERAALLRAVSQAQSVVERRNTIPILANVLIEAEGETASFRATDLDIEVVDRIPAQVERAGATTVSAVTLHEIVRKLPDGALVSITEDTAAGRLMVEAGRSTFQLATLPKEDFPVMAATDYAAPISRRPRRCCGGSSTSPNSPSRPRRRAITSTASTSRGRGREGPVLRGGD
jgi:DNA polymerase-3 subunit beta